MLLILSLACSYDMESWQSPLAKGFEGEPDPEAGEVIFLEEQWEDDSMYALTCAKCHNASEADTLYQDEGELNRPGHTVYNAGLRGSWKNNEKWNMAKSDTLGAFGGQICVDVYFPGDSQMTAEQAAHLEAYLKTRTDADPGDDPRAQPLGTDYATWHHQSEFLASIEGKVGEELGSVDEGRALAEAYCGSCHRTGEGATLEFFGISVLTPEQFAQRIRRATIDGVKAPNSRMPRIPDDRLSDDDLKLILAYLTAGR
jgi:mono/diheme cytochrome c family protein